jgi:3'-5' exoribonuclease
MATNLTLLEDGVAFEEELMVSDAGIMKTKTGKDYLACSMGNSFGRLPARMWTLPPNFKLPATGDIYRVTGSITSFNGQKQLNVSTMNKLETPTNLSNFIQEVSDPVTEETFNHILDSIINRTKERPYLQIFLATLLAEFKKEFWTATAAKGVHHVGVGGLIKHSVEVYKYAFAIYSQLPIGTAAYVRDDILLMGALFHDIGKVQAYTFTNGMPAMSDLGLMQEHIICGIRILDDIKHKVINTYYADENNEKHLNARIQLNEDVELLMHIIAAHHEELEFGSPVNPVTLEALIVAHADKLSADLDSVTTAIAAACDANRAWTDKIYTQHNRAFRVPLE